MIGLVSTEQWENIGDLLRVQFHVPMDQSVRPYKGLGPAVVEIAMSTAQFFAHKRSVSFAKGLTPHIENIIPFYIKEAYQVQSLDPSLLIKLSAKDSNLKKEAQSELEAWIQSLKKDTLFVVAAEDHPITGEIYDLHDLERLLSDKKIFLIRLSHANHTNQSLGEVSAYSVRICSFGSDLALAIFGSKFKSIGLVSQLMPWSFPDIENKISRFSLAVQDQQRISNFKTNLKENFYSLKSDQSLGDRLVLHFQGVSADRLIDILSQSVELQKESGLSSAEICKYLWTPNACFNGTFQNESKWWYQGPSAEQQKEMLVVYGDLLKIDQLPRIIVDVVNWIKSEQTWTY